jgi:2-dehydropantoate 2-reductase
VTGDLAAPPAPRAAVVGPGAIGLAFAAALQQAGRADLVLCGRRPLPLLTARRPGQEPVPVTAPLRTDPADIAGPADVVLLAVKAYQTAGAAGWLARLCGPATVVAVLQNGVEQVATVAPLAGGATVLPSTVWCPAEAVAPGQVVVRARPRLGLPPGRPAPSWPGC